MQKRVDEFVARHGMQCGAYARFTDLVSEVGELGKELLKGTGYGKQEYEAASGAEEEAGDCLFALMALCSEMGIDAEKALDGALTKYSRRFAGKGSADSGR